jgi:1,4-alpha-glucan branching enzyme
MKRRAASLNDDVYLAPYLPLIEARQRRTEALRQRLTGGHSSLADFASGHEYYGLHYRGGEWVLREWAPNASSIRLIGDCSGWQPQPDLTLRRCDDHGSWELRLPADRLRHGQLYRLRMEWPGGGGDRIPAWARRVVQDEHTKIFNAQVWAPPSPYAWRHESPMAGIEAPLVYEAHIGMAQERPGVGTYEEFRKNTLPRVVDAGYNVLQLMAIMEHPYYGSFGYHVSSFFAASSRFGTPDELKALVDEAHGAGLGVIMDLVHSHAVTNEAEGIARYDGTDYQFFHTGVRGYHAAWDSRCFNYAKPEVLHFLLSNCRFWLDEYRFDGFRFDGVTSMLYLDHGLGTGFTSYDRYFDGSVDEDAISYLTLANHVIHTVRPNALTIAEDVSGMPGLSAPVEDGGCGFDARLAMGIPDCWFKLLKEAKDEDWQMGYLWHELTNRRADEQAISYVECHDQAIVGGKTFIFSLIDANMYRAMRAQDANLMVDRGMSLHKMARLVTLATADRGYLTFIGNEFGHPEWVDFPREGNGWSYHYARRQWSLRDNPDLKYHFLADFDRAIIRMTRDSQCLVCCEPHLLHIHNDDKVLAFERGGLLFVCNFHPVKSFTDYGINAPEGRYDLVLDTDELRFGGHRRIQPKQSFFTHPAPEEGPRSFRFTAYLPSRTALILRRVS